MGIPGLFAWLQKNCPYLIRRVPSNKNLINADRPDVLCLDMNGIFHEACQKVYKYGKYKPVSSIMHPATNTGPINTPQMMKQAFYEIGNAVHEIVQFAQPQKKLLIMIDGPAGASKMQQQRSRRYRSVQDPDKRFDSNCISPGTEWMDYLSRYLDSFIRKQVTQSAVWKGLTVIFSNDKVPGEGEHKLIQFVRKHGTPEEKYMFYGLDADLIMLTLSVQNLLTVGLNPPKFSILREDIYRPNTLLLVDISALRQFLIEELTWGLECSRNSLVNDFIFLCFLLGNDFLPHSPSIDLIDGGLETLFHSYSTNCEKVNKHLIVNDAIETSVLQGILQTLALTEKTVLQESTLKDKFADPLLEKHIVTSEATATATSSLVTVTVDDEKAESKVTPNKVFHFDAYRTEYYKTKFPSGITSTEVCHQYFRGMEWVYRYYTKNIPSWSWFYPFSYSPFAQEMVQALSTYKTQDFPLHRPPEPFKQLLSILPPQSKELLPSPFHSIIEKFPFEVKVDLAGKKFDWQGVVLVPPLQNFDREYGEALKEVDERTRRRNYVGKEYLYRFSASLSYEHRSYYHRFLCSTEVKIFG